MKILKDILPIAVAFGMVAGAATAAQRVDIDPAYKRLTHVEAMKEASKHKHFIEHSPVGDLKVAMDNHHLNAVEAAGLRELVKANVTGAGDLRDYIDAAKAPIIRRVDLYIDGLLPGAANFIDGAAQHDGLDAGGRGLSPASESKADFKAALADVINAQNEATAGMPATPPNLKLHTLVGVESGVNGAFAGAVNAWIDALGVPGGGNFLDVGVGVGGPAVVIDGDNYAKPANIQRNTFKTALARVINGTHF